MNKIPKRVIFISLGVSLGGFLFGFDASVISGIIKFIRPQFQLNEIELGWVVSSPTFSAMFAMLIAGRLSDVIGRKQVLQIIAFLYLISALISSLSPNIVVLVAGRMLGGIAFGGALVITPLYLAEIAPAENRGKLVSVQQLNIVLGFSAAFFSNYLLIRNYDYFSLIDMDNIWRWMLALEVFPALLYIVVLFFVPKSPRWLVNQGRDKEAKQVLKFLHGVKNLQNRFHDIAVGKSGKRKFFSPLVLIKKRYRFIIFIGLLLAVFQQITGINVIFFYSTTIFEQSGIGREASFAQAVLVGLINVVFTILAMYLIDKIGRKPLIIIGLAGIAISMGITSYGFYKAQYELKVSTVEKFSFEERSKLLPLTNKLFQDDKKFKKDLKSVLGEQRYYERESVILSESINMNANLILVGILGFVAAFAFSLGPVMWVMLSEIFPTHIRGVAISSLGFINSLVSWFVQFVFPLELSLIGNAGTYLIYSVLAVIGLLLFLKFLPETKGRSLEQIEAEFAINN
ncbi:MAG: sugar porter family MFS transporter [Balneola sp.]|nr:sugar porter family MFS transporter [Balneola sp.]MBO6652017.1 sugar porter family MFS transporter [Balneola sp.]MBO6711907.1 sugar porter family MFS transporter [Balneola sp.]MBO6800102.1 sugar porter family MFS transporter [Balneola sp.]MBO6871517.1 sugar porter family MFS transporter [Balneola sp.]